MIVVDASVLVDLVLPTGSDSVLRRTLFDPEETLHAPQLIDLEVINALRRLSARRIITDRAATLALRSAHGIDLIRYPHVDLLSRIWELRHNATAYDAAYLALAEVLGAPLLTRDARLRDIPGCSAAVEVV